jgi:hypothetical protein
VFDMVSLSVFRPALVLMAVWLFACLFGPVLLSAAGVDVNVHGHAQLHAHGHPFVDARTLWGMPNAMDVLSNLPLAIAGVCGWWGLRRRHLGALGVHLGALIAIYALAKLFELGDEAVFHATGDAVSGHSLKHVTAAFAVWPVWSALRQNPRATGRTAVPVAQ